MEKVKDVTNEEPRVTEEAGVQVFSPGSLLDLSRAASWMKFWAIVHYVMAGVALLATLLGASDYSRSGSSPVVLQVALAFLLILAGWYLQSTSNGYRKFSLDQRDIKSMEAAFSKEKRYWMLVGIMTLSCSFTALCLFAFVFGDIFNS
jgi:hypothetical protein